MQSLTRASTLTRGVSKTSSVRGQSVVRRAKAGNWYPGGDSPAHLDGSLPGDYGFDPAGLGKSPGNLSRFREAEVLHGRWAMLGAVGCIVVEASGNGNWLQAPQWAIDGSDPSWLGQSFPFALPAVLGIQFVLMAGAEIKRNEESDPIKRIYPGGSFDPLGYAEKNGASGFEELKLKEIKNGRLAMFAMAGFYAQGLATGSGPLADLSAHLASPFGTNIATNGVSVPIY
ncbi:light harvesting complex protein I-20 [Chloropicon primus]|nr:light harvesting complex protein I-20 [Chloropicon primus]UPQ96725.1 light harvesting complex protein I-20 [Chloropicon primus]|mmetsp:Transcript_2034/g.5544  ORF Transcript_2034/g.5544 Transcript_2034/m.5544 type:complete len:229 (+) Transcript_2034:149-835(+)|eukprot:QDZ17505.1 light harvesting complex protein I-20 [Chloropicon primus]